MRTSLSCLSALTNLSTSMTGSLWSRHCRPMSTAIITPVRPAPDAQCTTTGPEVSHDLIVLYNENSTGRHNVIYHVHDLKTVH